MDSMVHEAVSSEADVLRGMRREHAFKQFPRTGVTKEMVLKMAEEYDVHFVDMQFIDILGVPKAVTIPVHKLEDAIDHDVWFDGSSIEGFGRIFEADMVLRPDLNTFAVLPWTMGEVDVTARLICDVHLPTGEPYANCPRNVLKRQIEEAAKLGYAYNTGPELEFFLFELDENGDPQPLPHDQAGYFDMSTDKARDLRRHMTFALEHMGIEVEALHHEVAPGQHEINFKYGDALTTADNAITFKLVLKAMAERMGLHVTFMPKPFFGMNGSGMHVHQSLALLEDGTNVFYDGDGVYGLSETAQSFVAGQLKHVKAMNALMNPTVNSYKRLVAGYEAPVNIAWGQSNRSALIRVPQLTPAQAKRGARIELRCPDPASNPYLAFAAMLAAGLDGVKNQMSAPQPEEGNIWKLSREEMEERGIETVSSTLLEALECLEADPVVRSVLGEDLFAKFKRVKMKEWDSFRTSVSAWELERYMNV